MSYRSKGLWVIKGPANDILAAWVACRLAETPPNPAEWDQFKVFYKDGVGYIRLEYSGWKWYDNYSDIRFFERVWSNLNDFADEQETNTVSGRRIRVGEENDDIDNDSFGDNTPDIFTSTSIIDDEISSGQPFDIPAPSL